MTVQAVETKKSTSGGSTDLLQLMLNAENLEITEEQKKENEEFGATYEKGTKEGLMLCIELVLKLCITYKNESIRMQDYQLL